MTFAFRTSRYHVALVSTAAELAVCQELRHRCFFGSEGQDSDAFDARCQHIMVSGDQGVVATARVRVLSPSKLDQSYAAGYYDLTRLGGYDKDLLELGRFCIDPAVLDGDVLRLVWGALTQIVDENHVGMLFGCASFPGTELTTCQAAFGLLAKRHLGPERWLPGRKAHQTVPLVEGSLPGALAQIPPLLRTYLAMGGWVSDHAVVDKQMNTMHVFTGLEINRIPPRRAAALRAIVGTSSEQM